MHSTTMVLAVLLLSAVAVVDIVRGNFSDCGMPNFEDFINNNTHKHLTTNQGVAIADDDDTLKAGERGPSLLEDFIFREKITHFDHERIPERVVHARGAAAHGIFEPYENNGMSKYTMAKVFTTSKKTPTYVRFSTVGGSRGSADTVRDVCGFAVKFYTEDGVFDFVGNNIPVFFIQDAIKFPDIIHAVKPEPRNEIPQASSAHDTFYDFISLTTEATHMLMWLMSDRALPRSFANMQGFGVHTFRWINAQGQSHYVKYHWRPLLAVDSLLFDEAQKINGKDPDFHRRQLYEWLDTGSFNPEYELGVQIFTDEDANGFDFDILDSTKLIPEELIPVQPVGKLTLVRNPENYFAETEQVAYCLSHIVPGMDFTNDPLLQGRLFSYLDTQITRLGGPNFHEIPINRPRQCPWASNNQRDGFHRTRIDGDEAAYQPNTINGNRGANFPRPLSVEEGGFASYPERTNGVALRARSKSFSDHFSQATLFWNSLSPVEQQHIISAFSLELSLVKRVNIRQRVLDKVLVNVDARLAAKVAENIGLQVHQQQQQPSMSSSNSDVRKKRSAYADNNNSDDISINVDDGSINNLPADPTGSTQMQQQQTNSVTKSPVLSQLNAANRRPNLRGDLVTRMIAILVDRNDAADADLVVSVKRAIEKAGGKAQVVSTRLGWLGDGRDGVKIDRLLISSPSVIFDGVVVVGSGLASNGDAVHFVAEAYKHAKAVAAVGSNAWKVLSAAGLPANSANNAQDGVFVADNGSSGNGSNDALNAFIDAVSQHRVWTRKGLDRVNA